MRRLALVTTLAAALGCGDSADSAPVTAPDDAADATGSADATPELPPTEPDVAVPDPDPGPPPPPPFKPLANVYDANPIDTPETSEVWLLHLTSADHSLLGEFANVRNCTPDKEKGQKVTVGGAFQITLCHPAYTALPGEDGTYRHIVPPEDPGANDDAFAEVMMYHHMQLIHDYFKDSHGLTDLDRPLDAIVNLQGYVALCDDWASIGNAAFFPEGAVGGFGIELDLGIAGDAIIFGQTETKDFSYEADVVYHEYTHGMIGATRLNAVFADKFGVNNLPGALNEAYADYFACTLANDSTMGNYALNDTEPFTVCGVPLGGGGGANMARDLDTFRTCPDDLTAEVHADGEIFASALWAIREALGPEDADAVILGALVGFTQTTDFSLAAAATVEVADELLAQSKVDKVEKAFADRGLLACERVVPVGKVGARGIPIKLLENGAFQPNPWVAFTPGPIQLGLDVPPEATEVTLTFAFVGGGTPDVALAWRPGAQAITYQLSPFGNKPAKYEAVATTPLVKSGSTWKARLAGPCVSEGPWVVAIHNQGGDLNLASVKATPGYGEPEEPTCE